MWAREGVGISGPLQNLIGSKIVATGEIREIPLRDRWTAFAGDFAQPFGQLPVVRTGFLVPPVSIGRYVLQ